jgi:hypothetical protein
MSTPDVSPAPVHRLVGRILRPPMFKPHLMFIPLSCMHYCIKKDNGIYTEKERYRVWYLFGVRIVYYSTATHD